MSEPKESVYIAGPCRAEIVEQVQANIDRAMWYAERYLEKGYAVFCPHGNTAHMQGPDDMFLANGLYWLERCDYIVLIPGWSESPGTLAELELAEELGIKVIYEDRRS